MSQRPSASFRCMVIRCDARPRTLQCVYSNSLQGFTAISKKDGKPQARSDDGGDGSPGKRNTLKPAGE